MNLDELLDLINSSNSIIIIIIIAITGCIQIAPIKINPWTWAYNKVKLFIRSLFMGDVIDEIKLINDEIQNYNLKLVDMKNGSIAQKDYFVQEIKELQKEIKDLHVETNQNISDVKRQTIDLNYQLVMLGKDVSSLNTRVEKNKEEVGEDHAKDLRRTILEFGNDLYAYPEKGHTKEWFDSILGIITEYLNYCSSHPNFKNEQAVMTIEHIRNVYQQMCEDHSFL